MALEDDIRRLTEAVQELTAQLRQQTGNPVPVYTDNLEPLPREEAPAKAPAKAAKPTPPPAQLDYARDVQAPALNLVKAKGREALASILADFGAKRAQDIPAEQWPALIARIEEASA